jgi:hypothetical protein
VNFAPHRFYESLREVYCHDASDEMSVEVMRVGVQAVQVRSVAANVMMSELCPVLVLVHVVFGYRSVVMFRFLGSRRRVSTKGPNSGIQPIALLIP